MAGSIGGYSVVRELGAGAIGRVFEAVDPRTGRRVAIKTLIDATSNAMQRSLLDEAAVVAQLSHPHVVELLDVGRDDAGGVFLVMELVSGTNLRDLLSGWPGVASVFRFFDEILDALTTAHAQGIVHGDLKPANALVDADGTLKVTDFGIARVIDPLRRAEERSIAGTPRYMAPEQLFAPEDVGPATDLYAVGVMLREMLGRPEPRLGVHAEIARKLEAPAPFELRDGLAAPRDLGELVRDLLHPDPRRRPRFASRVRRELASIARAVGESAVSSSELADDATRIAANPAPASSSSLLSFASSDATLVSTQPRSVVKRLRPVPLVGRDAEIAELDALATRAAEGDGTCALVIVGRAGEGKSRLARHGFAAAERAGTMVGAAASFSETGGAANVDLRGCAQRLLGRPEPESTVDETLAGKWAWLASSLDSTDARALHRWLSRTDGTVEPEACAGLAATALCAAASVRPIYLWLDDVGWSQDGAPELVLRLLDARARIFVVATLRSGTAEHPRVRGWLRRVSSNARATVSTLAPLGHRARAELLRAVGGIASEPADALAALLDEPTLVLVEAARDWADEGWLAPSDDGYVPSEGVSLQALAESARDVVARRVGSLLASFGAGARAAERVMTYAALLGAQFEERLLRACVAGTDAQPLVDAVLDRALLVGVLRVQTAGVYRFDHQLFAESLLRLLVLADDAPELRVRTARVLEETYGELRPDAMLRAAGLYRAAGASEDAYAAAQTAVSAFARASVFDQAEAVLATMARWVAQDGIPDSLGHAYVHRAKGTIGYWRLEYSSALEHYRRARAAFLRHGKNLAAARVAVVESSVLFYSDRLREMQAVLAEIPAISDDPGIHVTLEHRFGEVCVLRCDLDGAIAHERRALAAVVSLTPESARHSTPPLFVSVALAELLLVRGDLAEGARRVAEAAEAIAVSGRPDKAGTVSSVFALVAMAQGNWAEAATKLRPWVDALARSGNKWLLTNARALLAACEAAVGSEPAAVATARDAIRAYREVPHDEAHTWWAIRVAESWLRGRGLAMLADELGAMLDERQRAIAAAFEA